MVCHTIHNSLLLPHWMILCWITDTWSSVLKNNYCSFTFILRAVIIKLHLIRSYLPQETTIKSYCCVFLESGKRSRRWKEIRISEQKFSRGSGRWRHIISQEFWKLFLLVSLPLFVFYGFEGSPTGSPKLVDSTVWLGLHFLCTRKYSECRSLEAN